MMKLFIFLAVVVLILGGLFLGRESVLEFAVERAVEFTLGAPVNIGKIDISLEDQAIFVKDFKLYNPKGFPRGILLYASDIKIVYAKPLVVKSQIQLLQIDAKVKEVVVIKKKDGRMNVDALKGVGEESNVPEIGKGNQFSGKKKIHTDVLTLSIDQVVSKDYTVKDSPKVEVYDVRIKNKHYKDIPGVQTVFMIMLQDAMAKTAIKGAAVFGIATAAGVTFWPVGVAAIVIGKDSARAEFSGDEETVYQASIETLEKIGKLEFNDQEKGVIKGTSKGHSLTIKISGTTRNTTKITVSARELLLPGPKYAQSVLYQISEKVHAELKEKK